MAGGAEGVQETGARINGGLQQHEGIGLFGRHAELAVGLHFFAGGIPPAFEAGCVEHSRGQRGSDLLGRSFAAEVGENFFDQCGGVGFREFAKAFRIGLALGKDVVLGDRREGFSRIHGLHRVVFLGLEINQDLAGKKVPFRDTSEAPALVGAVGSGREAGEFLGGFFIEGAAVNGLGEFICHPLCCHRKPPIDARGRKTRPVAKFSLAGSGARGNVCAHEQKRGTGVGCETRIFRRLGKFSGFVPAGG